MYSNEVALDDRPPVGELFMVDVATRNCEPLEIAIQLKLENRGMVIVVSRQLDYNGRK